MRLRASLPLSVILLVAMMGANIACSKAPNDSQISSQLQDKLNSDSGLQGKQLSVQSSDGKVTLSGIVDNDAQRDAAARYASGIAGVKQVVNNLQVGPPPAPVAQEAPPAPAPQETPKPAPAPKVARKRPVARDTAMILCDTRAAARSSVT